LGEARFSDGGGARFWHSDYWKGSDLCDGPRRWTCWATLGRGGRRHLAKLGLRMGREHVWIAGALTPHSRSDQSLAVVGCNGQANPELPKAGRKLMPAISELSDEFYRSIGYRRAGHFAWRVDAFEALADAIFTMPERAHSP
jgi:hypothetical protein